MEPNLVRVAQALDVLASLKDVDPVRAAVIGASRDDPERTWAASSVYRTVDKRLADISELESEIPRLAAREAQRLEKVWGEVAAALRAVSADDQAEAARRLIGAGEVEEEAGRLGAAEQLYERARQVGRKPRDRTAEGLALLRLARVAKARGRLAPAVDLYREAFGLSEAARYREGMIVACQGMGNCLVDRGNWQEAEGWYRRGLELVQVEDVRERWQIESNLSIVSRRAGRLEESERWLDAARATAAPSGEGAAEVFLMNGEGLLRMAQGRAAEAETIYRKAIDSSDSPGARATVLLNLSECLLTQGRITEAADVGREAEGIAIAHRLHPFFIHVYLALGAAARAASDPNAMVFYEQALELARAGENDAELAEVQREYAELDRLNGEHESAAARLREAADLFRACGSMREMEATESVLQALEGNRT